MCDKARLPPVDLVIENVCLITVTTREMCSCIDMQTHARWLGLGFVTFDLLTSGSVHVAVLPCLPNLVLLAEAVFNLELTITLD